MVPGGRGGGGRGAGGEVRLRGLLAQFIRSFTLNLILISRPKTAVSEKGKRILNDGRGN